ncbi:MAG: hypothetical protein K1X95_08810 [Acidimicrobiia bacterium]|nr:hypothetical protein [Acidimicrobiia bacterium]
MTTSPYYCSRCGYSWKVTLASLLARATGRSAEPVTPRCPRCAAAPFFEAECAWCSTMFLHAWASPEVCPTCGHEPYWAD